MKDISVTKTSKLSDYEIAPCLQEGPISEKGKEFIEAARKLDISLGASFLKASCIPYLFDSIEKISASQSEPISAMNKALESLIQFLDTASVKKNFPLDKIVQNEDILGDTDLDITEITGNHYGNLFNSFSSADYFDESIQLLSTRLERNNIPVSICKDKKLLDAGCGGGRYTVAWRLLGANPVFGLDVSLLNIKDANSRIADAGVKNVHFEQGNVLDLPYENNDFDVVFSNGVLHHTVNWKKGITELLRVLKPGGFGWLYLIEKPGGLFWDIIELMRVLVLDEDRLLIQNLLKVIGIPANRIFYMLDHVMVPINERLTPQEIENCLSICGATNIKRLNRGVDFDRIEQISSGKPYAEKMFGVGENRYIFSKDN